MASVYVVTMGWSGFQGAPGYSKFHFSDLTTDAARNAAGAAVRTLFFSQSAYLLTTWSFLVNPEVLEYDVATSALVGAASMTSPPAVANGTLAASFHAGGSGYVITWSTGQILFGHRVRGRTFMVPAAGCYDVDGTISAAAISAGAAAGTTFIGSAGVDSVVWAKQWQKDAAGHTVQPPVQIGGQLASITGASVKDMAAQMRSRRT